MLDDIIEFILEFFADEIFEGLFGLSNNNRVPKPLRIILGILKIALCVALIVLGIVNIPDNTLFGVILIFLGVVLCGTFAVLGRIRK